MPALQKLIFEIIILYQCISSVDVSSENDDIIDTCADDVSDLVVELDGVGELSCGQNVDLSSIGNASPTITYTNANDEKWYTLLMVDPDVPSPSHPVNRYWLHWIVSIQGSSLANGTDGSDRDPVTAYHRPSPPANVGPHRYQFFLYERTEEVALTGPSARNGFDPQLYSNENDLGALTADFQFITENS